MSDNSTADLPDPFVDDPELRALIKIEYVPGLKDPHWLWLGELDDGGYGVVWREGYNWRVHRWVWMLVHGFLDEKIPIDHVCRTRRCVNALSLEHLEAVTTAVNNARIPTWAGNAETCAKGHQFTAENTITRAGGKRRCRICHAAQERDRRARRRAAASS